MDGQEKYETEAKNPQGECDQRGSVLHSLMLFRVKEILLVSSLYDAYIIEEEGLISELIIGEYRHLLLHAPPVVTQVSSGEMALAKLKERRYDLVITMSKNIGMDPFAFGREVKEIHADLTVLLLAIDSTDVELIRAKHGEKGIDKAFFWTGNPTLFLAIIKYVEDSKNAASDTHTADVRVLIMLEDSIHYYSMFLPILYTEIVRQTQRSLSDDLNEMQQLLTRRARPKILLAETFEEGVELFTRYEDYIIGIITDVSFKRDGVEDPNAGFEFTGLVKQKSPSPPVLIQSSDATNSDRARKLGAVFLDKNSSTLLQDSQSFFLEHLGFGDFVFLMPRRRRGRRKRGGDSEEALEMVEIARASTLREFVTTVQKVPLESIRYHAERNDFSNWLFARCEFKTALLLRPQKVSDSASLVELRKYLFQVFNERRREKQLGVITDFSQQKFEFDSSFTRLTGDSLGGKGRGIAFMRSLLAKDNLEKKYRGLRIVVPSTVVIGTLEYDRFVHENNLLRFLEKGDTGDHEIAKTFLKSRLHHELREKLSRLLFHFKAPVAVRSSALLEDSQNFPFAGIYSTYMLPNNHPNRNVRLRQLCQAIKLVYASVFYREPRAYLESTSAKIEEEKMAIIVQELAGSEYGGRFYPAFSGVAQSYNFYPVSHQKFEDGIVSVAAGLGRTIGMGERVLRFCPRYPDIVPEFSSTDLMLRSFQREAFVLDTGKQDFELSERDDVTLKKLNIADLRTDGTLDLIASTYDSDDGIVREGISEEGPLLVTFAPILKHEAFPLSPLTSDLLEVGQAGMGCPVEIEFAVDLNPRTGVAPTFALLQIRPLVPSHEFCEVAWDEGLAREKVFISSQQALGNGLITTIRDIVYIPPDGFDPARTVEIAEEVGKLNHELTALKTPFILIGPGRWGTQDRWLGVPVRWSQISGVRVLVEVSLENFNVQPSQGTHFFQNIVSRGIGYLHATHGPGENFIDWDWLEGQEPRRELRFVRHTRFPVPLTVRIDGRRGRALVEKPSLR
jgi:hypothetical protein